LKKHVLVTGGAGYIGSHACKRLAQSGFVPVAYDNLVRGHEWAVKWGPFEQGSTADRERLLQVIERYRPDAALHFAADAYVGESIVEPEKYYQNNVSNSIKLLSALREGGVRSFVFSSSCAIYGVPEKIPIRETEQARPINPYGFTKFAVERMLWDYAAAYNFRFVILRYFNAAGADPDGEIGEDHDPETHLVPVVLDVALGRRCEVQIYGTDYDTVDGTCIRDYIHVVDLADAHVLAVRRLVDGGETVALNLGTGTGFSVKQVIDTAELVTGRKIARKFAARRPGDPPVLVANLGSAKAELGWSPRRASLQTQIKDAWAWHSRHFSK
jgi:UDP-glucose-4-epimerase GalE